jgi:hypothetical protein
MMKSHSPDVEVLKKLIESEVIEALAWPQDTWRNAIIDRLLSKVLYRFSEIALRFEAFLTEAGFPHAAELILPEFIQNHKARGVENIPSEGPLLIAANHPGTYDSLVIAANLPRPDIKIIAGGIPFLQHLPRTSEHMIYTPKLDLAARANTVRAGIRHLLDGGVLMLFAGGGIDPDPAVMPGAEIEINGWSRSLQVFLRRAPQTQILVAIVSGVLDAKWVNHPLTRLRRQRRDRQRLAEMLQIMRQLNSGRPLAIEPRISFSEVLAFAGQIGEHTRQTIIQTAENLLADHLAWQT